MPDTLISVLPLTIFAERLPGKATDPDFVHWPSIQRLSSEKIVITEKIDGTNGVIFIPEDGSPIRAGSRNRWLTPESDNFGFCAWVTAHAQELCRFGPGYHFGEWYGQGIQRGYGLNGRYFASFEYHRDDLPDCVQRVPILYEGTYEHDMADFCVRDLRDHGSHLVPGFMDPEGVVISFRSIHRAAFKKFVKNDLLHKHQQQGAKNDQ
jgi:hypothetical protein